jgi:hypothetical protein
MKVNPILPRLTTVRSFSQQPNRDSAVLAGLNNSFIVSLSDAVLSDSTYECYYSHHCSVLIYFAPFRTVNCHIEARVTNNPCELVAPEAGCELVSNIYGGKDSFGEWNVVNIDNGPGSAW